MSNSLPKTLLVVKNRAMGDAIMGLATIQYLKSILPETKVIYAVPSWIAPLLSHSKNSADEIYPLDLKGPFQWIKTYQALKEKEIDTVFEMFQSGRTRKFFNFFPTRYFAHDHHSESGLIHDQGVIKSNIQRDLDGAWTFFGKNKPIPQALAFTPQLGLNKATKEKSIILGVVATRETKMWALSHYHQLIELILKDYPDYQIKIPLSCSEEDQIIKKRLSELGPSTQVHFIQKSLSELPQELSQSQIYIGNDTGLKHLAIALGLKTFTFFGPEPPLEWHPYDQEKHPYFFLEDLECRTRAAHYCGLSQCDTMDCLKIFRPHEIWKKIKSQYNF